MYRHVKKADQGKHKQSEESRIRHEKADRLARRVSAMREFEEFSHKPFPIRPRQSTKNWHRSGAGYSPQMETKTGERFWKTQELPQAKTDLRTTEEKILTRRNK